MPRPHRTLVLAALLVAILALVGCGAGDEDGGVASTDGAALAGVIVPAGDADEGIDGVEAFRVESNEHTDHDVDYDVLPPPGGPHNEVWANCGFYDEEIDDEHIVHDLEHGAVWLAYSADLTAGDTDVLHELARANDKVIATPYPELPSGTAVVASAWARQLTVDSVDDPRLEQFVITYQDGSQAPEAGDTCGQSPLGDPIP